MVYRGKRKEYQLFADRLHDAMDSRGYSQTGLANAVGLSKGMISLYCAAKSMPESDRLAVIAHELRVSPVWLMGANVEKDGTAIVHKSDDAKWLNDKLSKAPAEKIALLRRLYEALEGDET